MGGKRVDIPDYPLNILFLMISQLMLRVKQQYPFVLKFRKIVLVYG